MVRRLFLFAAQNRAKIGMRAEYTETKLVYVYTETKTTPTIYIL